MQVLRASCDVARGPQIYEPSLVIIAQGSKLAYLGPRTLEYGAGHYLIQALPVPFECETFSPRRMGRCWAFPSRLTG